MPHFMFKGKYTASAVKTLVENPQDRQKAAAAVIEGAGGKLLSFYFAFGHDDVIVICEMPDAVSAAAVSMVVGGAGSMSGETVPLLTMHEAMEAMRKAAAAQKAYRSPSG